MQVPVADLGRSPNGSVLAAPMVYIPANAIANTTTEYGLRFRILKENSTSYINELSRLYYYVSQIALGNKRCSPGYGDPAHRCIGQSVWLKLHLFFVVWHRTSEENGRLMPEKHAQHGSFSGRSWC